jgi:hypothetical protein
MPIDYLECLDHLANLEYVAHLDHLEYLHNGLTKKRLEVIKASKALNTYSGLLS